jgi:hypothetical protein
MTDICVVKMLTIHISTLEKKLSTIPPKENALIPLVRYQMQYNMQKQKYSADINGTTKY